jgi:hypothetical protein
LKIIYYTSGTTGAGRVVRGIAIGNAFKRKKVNIEYTIVSSSSFGHLIDRADFSHIDIRPEAEDILAEGAYLDSDIYSTLNDLKPDVLLVDLLWFPLHYFIDEIKCGKIFLCRQVDYRFFSIRHKNKIVEFNPKSYDRLLAIEPFRDRLFQMKEINPIIIRNHDEILPRNEALSELGLNDSAKTFLLSHNGVAGEFEHFKKKYRHLEKKGYKGVYSTNYAEGIFPTVDYFNAFNMIICGAGYNSFWEVRFFKKDAIIIPTYRTFESGEIRMKECKNFEFRENGADQLVEIAMNL